jgi:hypothetical protein
MQHNRIERAPHPADSPEISPCDSWLYGFLKEKFKEQEPPTSDEIIEAITTIWNNVIFGELQNVFSE